MYIKIDVTYCDVITMMMQVVLQSKIGCIILTSLVVIGDLQELCGSHPGGGHQQQDQDTTAHLLQGKGAAIYLLFQDFQTIHMRLNYFTFLPMHFRFVVIKHTERIERDLFLNLTISEPYCSWLEYILDGTQIYYHICIKTIYTLLRSSLSRFCVIWTGLLIHCKVVFQR